MWIGEKVGVGRFSGINSVGVEKENSQKKSQKEKPKEKPKEKKGKGSGESGKNTNRRAKTSRGQS